MDIAYLRMLVRKECLVRVKRAIVKVAGNLQQTSCYYWVESNKS